MRLALALICLPLLCGWGACQRRPTPPQVVYVTVTEYVGVPERLTVDCGNEKPREQTNGEAKRLANVRDVYLTECTNRMREIRALPTKPEAP